MSAERWLWKVVVFNENSTPRTEWVVADTIDETLRWVTDTMGDDDRIDSIVCKGLAEVMPPTTATAEEQV